jgi:hypothetical protein
MCRSRFSIIIVDSCFKKYILSMYYLYIIKPKGEVIEWKGERQMHLNVNHAILNNNIQKRIPRFLGPWSGHTK